MADHAEPLRTFGWQNMFLSPDDDPRADGAWSHDERSTLLGFLNDRRSTLELKCVGLTAAQLAERSIPPSDLSLVGLVRHLTGVENYWFQQVIRGQGGERMYRDSAGRDLAFDVQPSRDFVHHSIAAWHAEIAQSNLLIGPVDDLSVFAVGKAIPIREVLIHLIAEYARHLGHADLLRERIDGRVGQ